VTQNTAGINIAIATYSGTGANLVLPNGDIFVEEQAPGGAEIRWCIKFGTGVSKLTLSGQGMFATTLVQLCVGDFGELNLLNIDGATRLNLEGYRLQYHGASPGSRHGVLVQTINSDVDDIRISDINIVSSTGKLQAAVNLAQRNSRSIARIKISGVRSAGSASHGLHGCAG
jgi:hypothetical protein